MGPGRGSTCGVPLFLLPVLLFGLSAADEGKIDYLIDWDQNWTVRQLSVIDHINQNNLQ